MRRGVILVLTLFLNLACGTATEEGAPDGAGQAQHPVPPSVDKSNNTEAGVRAVVLQNKTAREGFSSYSINVVWERRTFFDTPLDAPLPEGKIISYGEAAWMEQGAKWHEHLMKRWEAKRSRPSEDRGIRPPELHDGGEYSSWSMYNGAYHAWYNGRHPGRIYLIPQNVIDANGSRVDENYFSCPLRWGSISRGAYLSWVYENDVLHNFARWEREDFNTPDGPKIKLSRHSIIENVGHERHGEFVIDPERGYLLVSVKHWERPDTQSTQVDVTLAQQVDGIWCPSRIIERKRTSFDSYSFSKVLFNVPIEDAQFTIDAFDLDYPNTRLSVRKSIGSESKMLFRDGAWVDESLVPVHLRPVLPGDNFRVTL